MNSPNIRELAMETMMEIEKEKSPAHLVVGNVLEKYRFLPKQDRAFFKRLCDGCLENRIQMDYILNRYSSVPVRKMRPVIRVILRLAVYQIMKMDGVPDSAAVNEAVKLAVKKGFKPLKGYVNGVLRNIAREKDRIVWPPMEDRIHWLSVKYSMPEWLLESWIGEFGADVTEGICKAFLQDQSVTVRVRGKFTEQKNILESLRCQGVEPVKAPYLPYAYYLKGMDTLEGLESFRTGKLQVQDVSSMLAVEAAHVTPGDLVLDICAAPGGKSLLAADCLNGHGMVEARDLTDYKIGLIMENKRRCGVENLHVCRADARELNPEMVEKADVVIADLPCSGYGIIGKKPDIKYNASLKKQESLAALQREILTNAVQYVKPGGILLYSTCTLGTLENQDIVNWIMDHFPFHTQTLDPYLPKCLHSDTTREGYLQLIPGVHNCDGFFMARLIREK